MKILLLIPSKLRPYENAPEAASSVMDYYALRDRLRWMYRADVTVYGYDEVDASPSRLVQGTRRTMGRDAALGMMGHLAARDFDAVFTNGENVAIPFELFMEGYTGRRPAHVTIGHRLSTRKKRFVYRGLKLHQRMNAIFLYASTQMRTAVRDLGIEPERLRKIEFHADADFWHPLPELDVQPKTICSVGLEWRDYPTLIEALRQMPDTTLKIAAASPWSHHKNETAGYSLPANVDARPYDYARLRELYASSEIVAVPLYENDFQAGVTTLLEAMAMGKAVVCTSTTGQCDVIRDGINGLYVPVGDSQAWVEAIRKLQSDPELRRRLGETARAWTLEQATLDRWTTLIAGEIVQAAARRTGEDAAPTGVKIGKGRRIAAPRR